MKPMQQHRLSLHPPKHTSTHPVRLPEHSQRRINSVRIWIGAPTSASAPQQPHATTARTPASSRCLSTSAVHPPLPDETSDVSPDWFLHRNGTVPTTPRPTQKPLPKRYQAWQLRPDAGAEHRPGCTAGNLPRFWQRGAEALFPSNGAGYEPIYRPAWPAHPPESTFRLPMFCQ